MAALLANDDAVPRWSCILEVAQIRRVDPICSSSRVLLAEWYACAIFFCRFHPSTKGSLLRALHSTPDGMILLEIVFFACRESEAMVQIKVLWWCIMNLASHRLYDPILEAIRLLFMLLVRNHRKYARLRIDSHSRWNCNLNLHRWIYDGALAKPWASSALRLRF
jgi:hypothetical protein